MTSLLPSKDLLLEVYERCRVLLFLPLICFPVKIRVIIGKPLYCGPDESPKEFAERVRALVTSSTLFLQHYSASFSSVLFHGTCRYLIENAITSLALDFRSNWLSTHYGMNTSNSLGVC